MGSLEGWLCWQGCCERSINAAASIHPWIYVSPLSLFLCLFFPPSSFLFSSLSTSFFPHAYLLSRNFVVSFCLELVSIFHVPSPIVSSLSSPSPFFIRVVPKRFAIPCLCFEIEVHSTFSSWSILRVPAYTLPVSSSFSFFFQFVSLSSEEIPWISLSIFPIDSPTNVLIFIFVRWLSRFRIHFPSLRFRPREFSLALYAVTYNTNFYFLFIFTFAVIPCRVQFYSRAY